MKDKSAPHTPGGPSLGEGELLACPFCEPLKMKLIGPPTLMAFGNTNDKSEHWHGFCVACGAEGPKESTPVAAIAAWNRRAARQQSPSDRSLREATPITVEMVERAEKARDVEKYRIVQWCDDAFAELISAARAQLAQQPPDAEAFDANVNRLKACEHIADGDEGWEMLRNECPSTAAVARLRDQLAQQVAIRTEAGEQHIECIWCAGLDNFHAPECPAPSGEKPAKYKTVIITPPAAQQAAAPGVRTEIEQALRRYMEAVSALGRIKDGMTLFEHSPTKDNDCLAAWIELDAAGKFAAKALKPPMKLLVDSEWLQRKIAADPDAEVEAGPAQRDQLA